MRMSSVIKLIRPHHYIKNLFIATLYSLIETAKANQLAQGVAGITGIGGNFRVEWVAGFLWNGWQTSRGIRKAQQKGKSVLYTKWIWYWVMLIIRAIPEWKFKKMSI